MKIFRFEHKGYVLEQTSYNWHYVIQEIQSGRIVSHSSCTVPLTEEEAQQCIERYLSLLSFKDALEDLEEKEVCGDHGPIERSEKSKRFLEALKTYEKDPLTGTVLFPGYPDLCRGNGTFSDFECCCDECDHFLDCNPEHKRELDKALESYHN